MHFLRNVSKRPVAVISVEPRPISLGLALLSEILAHNIGHRGPISRNKNIWPPIIIVVKEPAREAHDGLFNTCLLRHVDELRDLSTRPHVAEKMIWFSHDGHEQVLPAVFVVIVRCGTLYHHAYINPGFRTYVRERTIAIVDIEPEVRRNVRPRHLVAHDLVPYEEVEQTVVIEISPNRGLRGIVVEDARACC